MMFGFKFVTFDWRTNRFECKMCGHIIFASNPSIFAKLAKEHRKTCQAFPTGEANKKTLTA